MCDSQSQKWAKDVTFDPKREVLSALFSATDA
jgi:hypothetical protein